jgi:hypothetical protein
VDHLVGPARNERLVAEIAAEPGEGASRGPADRQVSPPFQGLPPAHVGEVELQASRGGEGRVDRG